MNVIDVLLDPTGFRCHFQAEKSASVCGELCEKGIFLYFVQMGRREREKICESKYWAFVINRLLRF